MSQLEVRPAEADGTSLQIIAFTERLERSEDLIARQAKEIENLTKSLDTLERTVEDLRDLAKYTLSTLSKRVTSLEDVKAQVRPQKTEVTTKHLDRLADALLMKARQGQKGVTYGEAAKILRISKKRVVQLRTLISSDHRFNIDWHPNKKNMKIICLRR